MAAAGKSDLVFTKTTSDVGGFIEIPIAFDSVAIQVLINAVREYEPELANLDTAVGIIGATGIIQAIGKIEYPTIPGKFTGITATLINDWRVIPAARPGSAVIPIIIFGGTLFGINSFGNNPVAPAAFTQVQYQQAEVPPSLGEEGFLTTSEFIALKDN